MQVTTGHRAGRAHLLFRVACAVGVAMVLATFVLIWAYRNMEERDLRERQSEIHQALATLLAGAPGRLGALASTASSADASYEISRALAGRPESSASLVCPPASANERGAGGRAAALDARADSASSWPIEHGVWGSCALILRSHLADDLRRIDERSWRVALSSAALEGALLLFMFWLARRGDASLVQSEKEQQAMESELFFLANYDTLTHLPNRSLFWERLDAALVRGARLGKAVCLVLVDLRDFTALNEDEGRAVGDRALVEAARRIQASARSSDLVCRLGSDEFAILLEDLDPEKAIDAASRLSAALDRNFSEPWAPVCSRKLRCNCGGSLYPHDGASSEDLLASAQQAAKLAKERDVHLVFRGREVAHSSRARE